MWTLESALELIRELQPKCMARGYYLALAGGVLNNGSSDSDLDLVAMPMGLESVLNNVLDVLYDGLGLYAHSGSVPGGRWFQWTLSGGRWHGRRIDIVIVNN